MEADRESHEIDPDYESTNRAIRHAQIRDEEDNQLTEEKLHHIIRDEFDRELKTRQKQIDDIEDKIYKAQKLLHIIRYVLISSYYQNKALEYNSMEYEGSNIINGQNRIHPAVKKLLGGNVKSLDFLTPLGKRKSSSTTLNINSGTDLNAKKAKLDLESANPSFTPSSGSKPKTDVTIKHTDQEILTNRKKVQHQIVVGNTSLYKKTLELDNLTHKWMVYIKVYKGVKKGIEVSNIIDKVIFYLHPSYSPHDVVEISQAPFHLSRRGWGEFPLRVQIYFKSSINKPVDIIHHLKLSKSFSDRQTVGNETVVPIFLYDSAALNPPPCKQSVKIKQEKIEIPELNLKKEKIESIKPPTVQIKRENIWENVENLTIKQEDDMEAYLSSDVDSYRDSFSENMSENNDIPVSDDSSWEQGFKGFKKEEIASNLEYRYYSFNGRDDFDVDIDESKPILLKNRKETAFKAYSHAKQDAKVTANEIKVYSHIKEEKPTSKVFKHYNKNQIDKENDININFVTPDTSKVKILENDLVISLDAETSSAREKESIISESARAKSNIKTNCSIQEHSYSLPFFKEDSGLSGRRHSPTKKHSPIKQAPNNLIYGLGSNYESSMNHQKASPQILKVLRTASGQSIRLLPESFSQILLSNGGIVQLKLLQNQDSPHATTYAISNSDLAKLNLKPPEMERDKGNKHKIKFPKGRFKSMGEALPCLFKQLPLWCEKAKDAGYKATFPFTATSKEEFESWSFAKRVNAEWCRARTIKSILASERYLGRWNTKAILMYGRSHFVTPLVQYNLFHSDGSSAERKMLADVFVKSRVEGRRKFSYNENGNDLISVDALVEDVDTSSKSNQQQPPKQIINLVDQKRIGECAFVKEQALSCGLLLKQEELCKGVYMNAPERIILEAVKSFAEGLIRRARYFAVSKENYSDSTPITTHEVLAALNDRPEFKSIEKFQKTKITKDFFS